MTITGAAGGVPKAAPGVAAQSADTKEPPAPQQPPATAEDIVDISAEAKQKAGDLQAMQEELSERYFSLREELARAQEAGEGMAKFMREKIKCIQIAMRIISGNRVPSEDHRFLAEKDPELYAKAMSMRIEKAEPKEYERLSEDEEEELAPAEDPPEAADAQTTATEAAQPEAAAQDAP
jgi:hypothetical protein